MRWRKISFVIGQVSRQGRELGPGVSGLPWFCNKREAAMAGAVGAIWIFALVMALSVAQARKTQRRFRGKRFGDNRAAAIALICDGNSSGSGSPRGVFWSDGSGPNIAGNQGFNAGSISGPVNLEMLRQGNLFVISVNGTQVGQVADIGIFSSGNVYLGILVAPGIAFQTAHEIDPAAKLVYKEWGGENANLISDGVFRLVKGMISRQVPIDGSALSRISPLMARTPTYAKLSEVEANFKRLADLGLFVQVSEMDVKLRVPTSQQDVQTQIQAYVDMATACLASFNCISFSVWNPEPGVPLRVPPVDTG